MIFKSIRLKNFRQYKKDMTIDFSVPQNDSDNITLIVAANGVGKTTLLQAFRYCFYGASSNYLNLPKANELINNTLVDDLKDLDEEIMFVEVNFTHEGVDYLARRERSFVKSKGYLKENGREIFQLSRLTDKDGWKTLAESDAIQKIKSILPDGLSQVFMFDGERMERNISDSKFSEELKESILGILDIKKYDKLIDILGHYGKASSVIGMLNSRKKALTAEDKKTKKDYDTLQEQKNEIEKKIEGLEKTKVDTEQKISYSEEQQKKLQENVERVNKIKGLQEKYEQTEEELKNSALKYIKESKNALIYKLLLLNKSKYSDFINKSEKQDQFYSYLHINTLNDIIEKKICLCGRPVNAGSSELIRLNNLKQTSLPMESSQHLNMIDQKFKKAVEFDDELKKLENIKNEMKKLKRDKEDYKNEVVRLRHEISNIERKYGLSNQTNITELIARKEQLIKEIGAYDNQLDIIKNGINRFQKKIDLMDNNNEYNKKINHVISDMIRIKSRLEQIKTDKENDARKILARNFDNNLNQAIHGNYKAEIDSKYHIKIVDLNTNKDVTISLSTGQNIIISLSFIKSLIRTAKELSSTINKTEKYGVIMDAALSNLDEKHVDKICRYNLNNMDQLIFLSFKRQLRDEMYNGIKNNIGKAYILNKNEKGHIEKEEMTLNKLDQFIHLIEGEDL
ncbi:MAG TPA: AAA family ATPase [Gallicola sp.]|nr:AAA family ATPase [Gallicola sp.]